MIVTCKTAADDSGYYSLSGMFNYYITIERLGLIYNYDGLHKLLEYSTLYLACLLTRHVLYLEEVEASRVWHRLVLFHSDMTE